MSRLKEQYENEIVPALVKKFDYKNPMEVPKLVKIVVNMGVGEAKENVKLLDAAVADMETITGQHVVRTKAKKSIANFKLREGMPIGCKVTLRGERMYEFADRLINLALPRVRDFRGVNPNAFDGRGNYIRSVAWMSSLLQLQRQTRKHASFSDCSTCRLLSKGDKTVAKKSMKIKQARKPKFSTREYTRCSICGRPHSVLSKYGICRICFRELAYKGEIPGVKKASW